MKTLTKHQNGRYSFEYKGIDIDMPTLSECGRFAYDPSQPETERILRDYGFEIFGTGGGCTAWHQSFILDDGRPAYMLVTDNDAGHTAEPGDTIVGAYLEDTGDDWSSDPLAWWRDMEPPLYRFSWSSAHGNPAPIVRGLAYLLDSGNGFMRSDIAELEILKIGASYEFGDAAGCSATRIA